MRRAGALLAVTLVVLGCTTSQSRFVPLGATHPPRPENCDAEILTRPPTRDFERIARIDVHLEWSGYFEPRLADAVPELRKQACRAGADAVTEIEEQRGSHIETKRYHVIGTGIKYRN